MVEYIPPSLSLVYKWLSILGEYCVLFPLSPTIPHSCTPSTLTANCTHTKSGNIMASVHTALTCRLTDHLLRNFECISNCLTTQSIVPTKQCIVHNWFILHYLITVPQSAQLTCVNVLNTAWKYNLLRLPTERIDWSRSVHVSLMIIPISSLTTYL